MFLLLPLNVAQWQISCFLGTCRLKSQGQDYKDVPLKHIKCIYPSFLTVLAVVCWRHSHEVTKLHLHSSHRLALRNCNYCLSEAPQNNLLLQPSLGCVPVLSLAIKKHSITILLVAAFGNFFFRRLWRSPVHTLAFHLRIVVVDNYFPTLNYRLLKRCWRFPKCRACVLCGFLGKTSCMKFMKAQYVVDTFMWGAMSGLQMTATSLVVIILFFKIMTRTLSIFSPLAEVDCSHGSSA
jgi:hypothetical protein